nr:hypothetical protein CFP56_45878 [Quercus suber]
MLQVDLKLKICRGTEDHHRNGLLRMIQRTLKKNTKVLNEGNASVSLKERFENGTYQELEEGLAKAALDSRESAIKEKCSICESNSDLPDNCGEQSAEGSSNDGVEDISLAIVPAQKEEAASSSISVLIKELPKSKPGRPLLRHSILPDKKETERSLVWWISVVQGALWLPSRKYLYITNSDHKQNSCDQCEDQSSTLGSESGIGSMFGKLDGQGILNGLYVWQILVSHIMIQSGIGS